MACSNKMIGNREINRKMIICDAILISLCILGAVSNTKDTMGDGNGHIILVILVLKGLT